MTSLLFYAACAALPLLWGLGVARVLAAREAKKRAFDPAAAEKPRSDYSI